MKFLKVFQPVKEKKNNKQKKIVKSPPVSCCKTQHFSSMTE